MSTPGFTLIDKGTPGFTPLDTGAKPSEPQPYSNPDLAPGIVPSIKRSVNYAGGELAGVGQAVKGVGQGLTKVAGDVGGMLTGLGPQDTQVKPSLRGSWESTKALGKDALGLAEGVGSTVLAPLPEKMGGMGEKVLQPRNMGAEVANLAMLSDPAFRAKVSDATALVKTGDAITNGMTKLAKEQVRPVLNAAQDVWSKEVARHAQAVIQADEARAARGARINVNTNPAAEAAEAAKKGMKGYVPSAEVLGFIDDARQPMTLAQAKSLTSDLGKAIGPNMRRGLLQDASVMEELYNKLHEATQSHANDLGREYGNSWKQYIDVHAAHMERMKGIYGSLQEGFAGPDVMNKLIDTSKSNEFHQLVKDMKQYGVDTKPLESARQYGFSLQDTLQKTSNLYFGKIRAMIRYPWAAAPAAIGAAELAHLGGIPGMSFILPLIAAGKVANVLDLRQVKSLLNDIEQGKLRQGAAAPNPLNQPFNRSMPSPLETPSQHPPSGPVQPMFPTEPSPGGGGFKGGTNVQGNVQSTAPRSPELDVQSHSSEIERLKQIRDSGLGTEEERRIADEQLATHEELRSRLQGVKSARAYRGKR